jgi:hypothetical protein
MENLLHQPNKTQELVQNRAMQNRAVQNRAAQNRAVQNRAVQERVPNNSLLKRFFGFL